MEKYKNCNRKFRNIDLICSYIDSPELAVIICVDSENINSLNDNFIILRDIIKSYFIELHNIRQDIKLLRKTVYYNIKQLHKKTQMGSSNATDDVTIDNTFCVLNDKIISALADGKEMRKQIIVLHKYIKRNYHCHGNTYNFPSSMEMKNSEIYKNETIKYRIIDLLSFYTKSTDLAVMIYIDSQNILNEDSKDDLIEIGFENLLIRIKTIICKSRTIHKDIRHFSNHIRELKKNKKKQYKNIDFEVT